MHSLMSRAKGLVVGSSRAAHKIRGGAFSDLWMELDLSAQSQLYVGLFERELCGWLGTFSRGINTAIDVGAGEGEYTLYFLKKTSAKKVFAFEPSPISRDRLLKNLVLNDLADDARLVLSAQFVRSRDADDACSLDSLVPSVIAPCVVKMDVDGAEGRVLAGAQRIAADDVRWIIETHSRELEHDCAERLQAYGYWVTIVPNAWWRWFVPERRPSTQNRWLIAAPRGTAR